MIFLPFSFDEPESYLQNLIEFVESFRWLWENHAVDFYVADFWNTGIPLEWNDDLKDIPFQELLDIATYCKTDSLSCPSLISFIESANALRLPRDPSKIDFSDSIIKNAIPIDKRLHRGMGIKKRHEVERLASLINQISNVSNAHNIVDMGSGKGYLDLSLALQYKKDVLGVDDDSKQICGANFRLSKVQIEYKKQMESKEKLGSLKYINRRITINDSFHDLIHEHGTTNETKSDWMIVGLHTCGNLSPFMFKHFLSSSAKAMINIGCCYNHLDETETLNKWRLKNTVISELWTNRQSTVNDPGFPLSQFLKNQNIHLGFTAKTLACQSTCRWSESHDESLLVFDRHFFRAAFQYFLHVQDLIPDSKTTEIIIGRLPNSAFNNGFEHYVKTALSRLTNLPLSYNEITESSSFSQSVENVYNLLNPRKKEIAIVWTLRALFADLFEAIVLIDRYIYFKEHAVHTPLDIKMVPIFDAFVSPRNMAISVIKL